MSASANRKIVRWLVAVGCAIAGLWLLLPGRNVAGNPVYEREIQQCRLPDGDLIRLYEGNGGATTAFWYTVTHESGWLSSERQIFFSYGVPEVREVTCASTGLDLTFWDGADETRETLSLERVKGKLRGQPLALRMGERVEPGGNPFRPVSLALGVIFLVVALVASPWRPWSRTETAAIESSPEQEP